MSPAVESLGIRPSSRVTYSPASLCSKLLPQLVERSDQACTYRGRWHVQSHPDLGSVHTSVEAQHDYQAQAFLKRADCRTQSSAPVWSLVPTALSSCNHRSGTVISSLSKGRVSSSSRPNLPRCHSRQTLMVIRSSQTRTTCVARSPGHARHARANASWTASAPSAFPMRADAARSMALRCGSTMTANSSRFAVITILAMLAGSIVTPSVARPRIQRPDRSYCIKVLAFKPHMAQSGLLIAGGKTMRILATLIE